MPGELYKIYANRTAINKKRTAIKGSGFSEILSYWSSRETSSNGERSVLLNTGNFKYCGKGDYNFVLGFLALEV